MDSQEGEPQIIREGGSSFRIDGRVAGQTVRIWDAKTGLDIRNLTGHTAMVLIAKYSPDGQYIASASADGKVRIWTVSVDKLLSEAKALTQRDLTDDEQQKFGLK